MQLEIGLGPAHVERCYRSKPKGIWLAGCYPHPHSVLLVLSPFVFFPATNNFTFTVEEDIPIDQVKTMKSLHHAHLVTATPSSNSIPFSTISCRLAVLAPAFNPFDSSLLIRSSKRSHRSYTVLRSQSPSGPHGNDHEKGLVEDPDAQVQDLRVPDHWLDPATALEV